MARSSRRSSSRTSRRRGAASPWIWVAAAVLAGGGVAWVYGRSQAIPLVQGTTVGAVRFPAGDTPSGGQGQPVHGIQCAQTETLQYHIHAHLSLFVHGRQLAIPGGIGIVPPRTVEQGFVVAGRCFYWLHTHDATGIIHVESPVARTFTLGDFFALWGRPLSSTDVAGFRGPVRAYVGNRLWRGPLGAIPLTPHQEITLEVGPPYVTPPRYVFPSGL